jgi:hypothetical protein
MYPLLLESESSSYVQRARVRHGGMPVFVCQVLVITHTVQRCKVERGEGCIGWGEGCDFNSSGKVSLKWGPSGKAGSESGK